MSKAKPLPELPGAPDADTQAKAFFARMIPYQLARSV